MSAGPSNRLNNAAGRGARKRPVKPAVFSGLPGTCLEKDIKFMCPVCFNTIQEAHMTKCGHSFCFNCIKSSLSVINKCPKCNYRVESMDEVFPNFALKEMIVQYQKEESAAKLKKCSGSNELQGSSTVDAKDLVQQLLTNDTNVDLGHVDVLLEVLQQKKKHLEFDTAVGQSSLLAEFLEKLKGKKQEQLNQINQEIRIINADLHKVQQSLSDLHLKSKECQLVGLQHMKEVESVSNHVSEQEEFGFNSRVPSTVNETTVALRRQKLDQHSSDLQQCYFSLRQQDLLKIHDFDYDGLDEFKESLAKFSKFTTFRPLASLNYTSDLYSISSIVSSIDFDKDSDFFAIAGVTKKIKVFEYSRVISDLVDTHYPVTEMVCNSKISCVAWSPCHKNRLASSDYEGTVTVWDAFAPVRTHVFQEHEKRAWCVDFNRVDSKLIASGSDDARVKIWSLDVNRSVANIEAKANVCCVQFNPRSRYHLAFGCADHCVHYYDLRNTKKALATFRGHRKAVSYAKFVNGTEIVSASTDSQLKMWSVELPPTCVRTFVGHVNEKNFVGLATDGEYVACGSEDNKLCVYYKGLSNDLFSYKFDVVRSNLDREGPSNNSTAKDEESSEFVSAVTWRPGHNIVVAANSQGVIKILELV